jgi:hypothetical protein
MKLKMLFLSLVMPGKRTLDLLFIHLFSLYLPLCCMPNPAMRIAEKCEYSIGPLIYLPVS